MLTPEQSRAIRTKIGLSQRRVATEASVPRSYLNQFERGRWIPTDDFLSKLIDFYSEHGAFDSTEPEQHAVEQTAKTGRAPVDVTSNNSAVNSQKSAAEALTSEVGSKSGWRTAGKAALAIALVGGILAATGNLPVALGILKGLSGARQPRTPFGL